MLHRRSQGDSPWLSSFSVFLFKLVASAGEPLPLLRGPRAGDVTITQPGDEMVFLRDPWGAALPLVKRAVPVPEGAYASIEFLEKVRSFLNQSGRRLCPVDPPPGKCPRRYGAQPAHR